MKVEELKISNYKSFREEQQIVCGRRNVFIGKNGSGKSNLLSGIENLFLGRKSGELQYNGKDSAAVVAAVISNPQKEYGLPERFVLEMICKDRIEYLIDKKSVSHSLVSTFSEVAGIREWAFVRQGEITEIGGMSKKDKYNYVLSVIGVNKYEKRKEEALKLLESNDIAKIEEMLEKIEEKVSFFESQRSKVAEYDILKEKKGGIEYDLMKWELLELNDEINKLFISHKVSEPKNEALLDFELEEVRNGICKLSQELAVIDNKLKNSCEVGKEEKKLFELQKQKEEELEKLMLLKAGIETEAQALRFFESMGTKSENIEVLERRVKEIERQLGMPLDGARNVGIESGIRERKEYWVKERQLKEDIEGLKEKEKRLREKLYCTGNESVSVYETVKDEEGVIGIVYELIDVPDEASEAFEAVAKSKAFWIVVENVEVGLQLVDKTDGVAGFLALDRIPEVKKTLIEDPRLVKLTSIIKCEKRIRKVLDFICKDFYVSTDLKGGVSLAEQYNANVVTTEGEIVTRSGLITGGYERGEQTLRDLQKYRKEMQRKEKELKEVQKYLEVLSVTSEGAEEQSYLPAMALACKWKISLIRDKKIKLRDKASIEAELAKYRGRVGILKAEIKAIERRLPAEKANEIEVTEKLAKRKKEIEASIEELKKKEYLLVDTIYGTDEMIKENNDFSTQKKHILIDKRSQLLSKMGKTDYHQSVPERTKEELKTEFRKVSNDLKRYAGCERAVKKADEGRKLREKIRSINQEKNYIRGFIEKADKRRDVIVAEALSVISREYACIYEEIWGSKSDLLVRGDAIDVRIGGEVVEPASLSGGQKTAVAFSMIMALQKYSPSPFYIFDELDANLDQRARKAVYYYIGKSNGQYFLTSFKEESLLCGDRFYGVVCSDKCSKVCQIEPDLALDMVRTSSSENNRIDSI